jgi:hypothetical protein
MLLLIQTPDLVTHDIILNELVEQSNSWESQSPSDSQNLRLSCKHNVLYRVYKTPPLTSVRSQVNAVHILCILMLSFLLRLSVRSGSISGFATNVFYALLISSICAAFPSHLIHFVSITLHGFSNCVPLCLQGIAAIYKGVSESQTIVSTHYLDKSVRSIVGAFRNCSYSQQNIARISSWFTGTLCSVEGRQTV